MFEKNAVLIRRFCYKNFNITDLDDVIQDALVKAFMKLENYDPSKAKFSTWLCSVAKNSCVDEIRKRKRKEEKEIRLSSIEGKFLDSFLFRNTLFSESDISSLFPDFTNQEREKRFQSIIRVLNEKELRVFFIRYGLGRDCNEIAEAMGTTGQDVRAAVCRGWKKINQQKILLRKYV
jgi:RNA polymerase sigma-70 factor (ECF subfamily)